MQSTSKQTAFLTQPVVVGLLAMLCCMLWGSAVPCVKIGYRLFGIAGDHTPSLLLFAGLRFTLAGLLALCIGSIGARRWLIPKPTSWPMILKLVASRAIIHPACYCSPDCALRWPDCLRCASAVSVHAAGLSPSRHPGR